MIIKFESSWALHDALQTMIADRILRNKDIAETDISKVLQRHQGYIVEPTWDYSRARKNWGWDPSTLRFFSKIDEHSCYLPESSPLIIKDIRKDDLKDTEINCSRIDLMRELNKLDIQIQKIKRMIEGE